MSSTLRRAHTYDKRKKIISMHKKSINQVWPQALTESFFLQPFKNWQFCFFLRFRCHLIRSITLKHCLTLSFIHILYEYKYKHKKTVEIFFDTQKLTMRQARRCDTHDVYVTHWRDKSKKNKKYRSKCHVFKWIVILYSLFHSS